jgi:peptidoglycan/LPS O-acetylase OafA/YrhL
MKRLPFLDFVRALASQLIVLHHMAFYGPLSDYARPLAPTLFDWLAEYARMAVQVFLVLGGFLVARSLGRAPNLTAGVVGRMVWARYRRIGIPYLVVLAVAVGANALASQWMSHESISAPPTLAQLLAHAMFLHDLLGYSALTAGIWYLAVDFQLFLLCLVSLWGVALILRRLGLDARAPFMRVMLVVLSPLALASLFWFNRFSEFDVWAIYFFGAHFLGFLLHEILERRLHVAFGAVYLACVIVAAIVDPRPRLLVAAATALVVYLAARLSILERWPTSRVLCYLGQISYSLFLIHFPVLLVVNAWGSSRFSSSPGLAAMGLLMGYLLSLGAAMLLYHGVERRLR